jgi:integrase
MAKKRGRKRRPWNKGIEVGPKDALTPNQVKRVRQTLARRGDRGLGDLTLFSLAIDTMLQGPELLNLAVKDVLQSDGKVRSVIEVARRGRKPAVRCALSKSSANALLKWITKSGKQRMDYVFSGRRNRSSHPMAARQFSRLLRVWISEVGLNPKKYGIESLRRTKALHILNGTGDLETVRVLSGHTKIESLRVIYASLKGRTPSQFLKPLTSE